VLDEYGGTDGIVTLKDLVERVVGDVGDEYAAAAPSLRPFGDGSVVVDGLMLVDDFNDREGAHLDSSEVDTLGGLALAQLGRMAVLGDEVDLGDGYRARVERLDGRRVAELRIWPPRPKEAPEAAGVGQRGESAP
jgi:putative hemolysin